MDDKIIHCSYIFNEDSLRDQSNINFPAIKNDGMQGGNLFTLGIDVGPTKICQETNIYFVAMSPNESMAPFAKVVWDMGETGLTFTQNIPANHPVTNPPDNKWMNSPLFAYKTPGNKKVKLTVYSQNASLPTQYAELDILVYPKPLKPVPDPADEISLCQGAVRELKIKTPLPTETINWYELTAAGWKPYSGTTPSPEPPTTTVGQIEYQVSLKNEHGCESEWVKIKVNVLPAATSAPTVVSPLNYCEGVTPASLQTAVTLGPYTTAAWYLSNDPAETSSNTPPVINTTTATTFFYFVSLKSTIGCPETERSQITININPTPKATLSILGETSNDIKVCQSTTALNAPIVNFAATSGQQPYKISYRLNNGVGTAQTLPMGATSFSLPVPNTSQATFNFELLSITDANNCQSNVNSVVKIEVLPLPVATVNGVTSVCLGASGTNLTFSGTGGNAPYIFTYEENNNGIDIKATSAGSTYSITPSSAASGTLTYHLKSIEYANTPACKNSVNIVRTVNIQAPPQAPTASSTTASYCLGTTGATLPTVTAVSGHTLKWYGTYATGGTATATAPPPDVSTVQNLKYYVSQYENILGCESDRTEINVTINPLPSIAVAIDGTLDPNPRYCQSSVAPTLRFTSPTGKSPFTFTYTTQTGSGAPVTSTADPLATPTMSIPTSTPGITKYTPVNIKDANGCVRTLSGVLTVEILPTPSATITASTPAVCQNDPVAPSVLFTGSVGLTAYTPAYSFEYDINGVNKTPITSATGSNTKTEPLQTSTVGTFVYTLKKVSYTIGTTTCSFDPVSSSATIKVNPLPTATLTASSSSILICKDATRPTLTFEGAIGRPPYIFDFTRNGMALSESGSPTYIERVNTNITGNIKYQLTKVTDANGCHQPATGTIDIEVAPIPSVNAGPDVWIMAGQHAVLKATAGNANGLVYAWSPSSLVDDPTKLQPAAKPLSTTRFSINVTSDKGCANTDDVLVTVLLRPEIPNTFTPNGDGANDRWDIPNLSSYPNAIVEVYNTAGQVVFRSTGFYSPWDGTRNGRPLPVGTYYYVINTNFNNEKRAGYITLLR